jgi:hypothetical protein
MIPDSDAATQLPLNAERRAMLAPKLKALLADFAQLQALEPPELEPVSSEWLVRSSAQ